MNNLIISIFYDNYLKLLRNFKVDFKIKKTYNNKMIKYCVYLLLLEDHTYYVGITKTLKRRIDEHRRTKKVKELLCIQSCNTRQEATNIERELHYKLDLPYPKWSIRSHKAH
jgi:predicted GIY-YIG superfamily endonuclease